MTEETISLFSKIGLALASGLIGYGIDRFAKRGRITFDNLYSKIVYRKAPGGDLIIAIELDLQFINTSSEAKIISQLRAWFHYNNSRYPLTFDEHTVPPAYVIAGKEAKCLCFKLLQKEDGLRCALVVAVMAKSCSLEVHYLANKKPVELLIVEFELEERKLPLVN